MPSRPGSGRSSGSPWFSWGSSAAVDAARRGGGGPARRNPVGGAKPLTHDERRRLGYVEAPSRGARPDGPGRRRRASLNTPKLALYQSNFCGYCVRVRRAIERLGLDVEIRDVMADPEYRRQLVEEAAAQARERGRGRWCDPAHRTGPGNDHRKAGND